jgi:hypothetical protein
MARTWYALQDASRQGTFGVFDDMVTPVSLDPGYHDPQSPYYRPTKADRERERYLEEKRKAEEAHARKMIEAYRDRQMRLGIQMLFGDS